MQQSLSFDAELIRRYDCAGPRYTSYPTALQFHDAFGPVQYRQFAQRSNTGRPLSLYFHIPFCATVCYYCACNKVITRNRARAEPYLESLYREIRLQAELFDRSRPVEQLHWGGGTPTFLSHGQMTQLMERTRRAFALADDEAGEFSVEIDPRAVEPDTVALLRSLGFNRISLGVQDFEPSVQKAVNRIQSEAQTFAVFDEARKRGFRSVNVDLIYGLPLQTVNSFERTLQTLLRAAPERISVFNYAHMPSVFKTQKQIDPDQLPSAPEKLQILQTTIDVLLEAGYVYIGMDHFARPDDELALAQRQGSLYRNFQGYSTHADCDLVAMGASAIGRVGDSYSQNAKTVDEYQRCLEDGRLPIQRGIALSEDDLLRRYVISRLVCDFALDFRDVEARYEIEFERYFSDELRRLAPMEADGLLRLGARRMEVLPAGRLLIRNICMVFDRYLQHVSQQRYSKVI